LIEYVGPNGEALTQDEWEALFHRRTENLALESWWRKLTDVDGVIVSTVWIGVPIGDLEYGAWETMLRGKGDGSMWKYATRQEAFDDHERIVAALRAGLSIA
jgi:hypothetical protein